MEAVSISPDKPNLRIVPLGKLNWQPDIIIGQEKPVIQGWYSANYGTKVPNPTLFYTTKILQNCTFAWILIPKEGPVPVMNAKIQEISETVIIDISGEAFSPVRVTLPKGNDLSIIRFENL